MANHVDGVPHIELHSAVGASDGCGDRSSSSDGSTLPLQPPGLVLPFRVLPAVCSSDNTVQRGEQPQHSSSYQMPDHPQQQQFHHTIRQEQQRYRHHQQQQQQQRRRQQPRTGEPRRRRQGQLQEQRSQQAEHNEFSTSHLPAHISNHPDHHLYPSYKLMSPNYITEHTYHPQRPLPLDFNLAASFPMPSPPHPSANYLPFLQPVSTLQPKKISENRDKVSRELSLALSQSDEMAAVGRQYGQFLSDIRPVISALEHSQRQFPNSIGGSQFSPVGSSAPSGLDISQIPLPGSSSPNSLNAAGGHTVADGMRNFEDDNPWNGESEDYTNGSNPYFRSNIIDCMNDADVQGEESQILGAVQEEYSIERLPYGRSRPVVMLLNQSPFFSHIHDILVAAGIYNNFNDGVLLYDHESDDDPAWKTAYMRSNSMPHTHTTATQLWSGSSVPFTRIWQSNPPDAHVLERCVEQFSTHIQAFYPIIPSRRLSSIVTTFLHRCQAPQLQESEHAIRDHVQTQTESATELLIFALGSACWAKTGGIVVESGSEFYTRAKGILEAIADQASEKKEASIGASDREGQQQADEDADGLDSGDEEEEGSIGSEQENCERQPSTSQDTAVVAASKPTPTLDLARAHLLAALFCGQLAWLGEAAAHVSNACDVILPLILRPTGAGSFGLGGHARSFSLIEPGQHWHMLSEDERQLVVLYWACVQLEHEISAEMDRPPSLLLRYQSMIPAPSFETWSLAAGKAAADGDAEMVNAGQKNAAATNLKDELNVETSFKAQICLRRHLNHIYQEAYCRVENPIAACDARSTLAVLEQQFDEASISQPGFSASSKSVLVARMRFAYWESRAYGTLHAWLQPQQPAAVDTSEIVWSLIETARAYHGIESSCLILPNAFGTAMIQCRYLLLLYSASRALPAVAALVGDSLLAELTQGTLAFFDGVAGPPGVLEAARRVLGVILARLQPQLTPFAAQARATALASTPVNQPGPATGLSLFCPPYSAVPELVTGLSTATTSSSFPLFPTPNTPHYLPSSAFTSPFQSPASCMNSPAPSPLPGAFVPACVPLVNDITGPVDPAALFLATGTTASGYLSSMAFLPVSEPAQPTPCRFADVVEFARQLGLFEPVG